MESLVASYASSEEEEEEEQRTQKPIPAPPVHSKTTSSSLPSHISSSSSLFSSLPQPKPSSLFQSLPQPKQASINPCLAPAPVLPPTTLGGTGDDDDTDTRVGGASSKFGVKSTSTLFSSLPKPKSQIAEQPKKVVQFKPPIIPLPNSNDPDEEDDKEEEEENNRRRKLESLNQTPSVKSFLSSIPAPRNTATLGVQTSSGSGRRSIVETDAPPSNSGGSAAESNVPVDQNSESYVNHGSYSDYQYGSEQNPGYVMDHAASYGNYGGGVDQSVGVLQPEVGVAGTDTSSWYGNNEAYASYGAYGDYGQQYGNNWVDGSAASTAPEASGISDNGVKLPGKRGRHEIPSEIIEVKQEELIKNRPREDQVKLTGIAFGPAYQPVSAKGKPSKLHKRKHQIGSLYYDMKQKEMELAERRAKGMLTKAETQAKYGW